MSTKHGNGDSENVPCVKAENAERKVLLEYLQWMRAIQNDWHNYCALNA